MDCGHDAVNVTVDQVQDSLLTLIDLLVYLVSTRVTLRQAMRLSEGAVGGQNYTVLPT